jgi:hypothetical protein
MDPTNQSAAEALESTLKGYRAIHVRGANWEKQACRLCAQNAVDTDLGKFSDVLPAYELDQEMRDRLIVHTRREVAETRHQLSILLEQLHRVRSSIKFWTPVWNAILLVFILWVGFLK